MEVQQYGRMFRRWFWLIALGIIAGSVIGYTGYSEDAQLYVAEATMFVGGGIFSPNPGGELRLGSELATIYAQLVKYDIVLQGAIAAYDLPLNPNQLANAIEAQFVQNTPLLIVRATYPDSAMAIDMANGVAEQLILNSPTNLTPEEQAQIEVNRLNRDVLQDRLNRAVDELQEIEAEIDAAVQARIQSGSVEGGAVTSDFGQGGVTSDQGESSVYLENLYLRRDQLERQMTEISTTISQYSTQMLNLQQRVNRLDMIQRASNASAQPIMSRMNTTLLWGAVGGVLVLSVVLLIEYFNVTIRSTKEAVDVLSLPVLGTIIRFGRRLKDQPYRLIINQPAGLPVVEGYRALETNLLYSTRAGQKVYIITSPDQRNGKTTTAANLAATMAVDNLRVLLIDADLRQPKLHQIFELDNSKGLTTLFSTDISSLQMTTNGKSEPHLPSEITAYAQTTEIPNLYVITSGELPKNPAYILNSASMNQWIELFRKELNADVIIIDTPPSLAVADAAIMATVTGASVVIVLEAGRTSRSVAVRAAAQFLRIGLNVRGIVLNKVSAREADHGHSYDYNTEPTLILSETEGGRSWQKIESEV